MSEPSPPPAVGGPSDGSPDSSVDDFLTGLLTGEVEVKVDPASGQILEVHNVPLDSPTEEAYDLPDKPI
jgi:hypothetical protein